MVTQRRHCLRSISRTASSRIGDLEWIRFEGTSVRDEEERDEAIAATTSNPCPLSLPSTTLISFASHRNWISSRSNTKLPTDTSRKGVYFKRWIQNDDHCDDENDSGNNASMRRLCERES